MSEEIVIAAGKDWLELLYLYEKTSVRDYAVSFQEVDDMKTALLRMSYVRFKREYLAYRDEQMKVEETTRQIEDEVVELSETKS